MFRRLSFYLGLLIGIAMLALLGLVLLFRSYAKQFDPAAWLSLQIGRPVLVRGGIEYFYFPWLGLALNQIEIGNPPGAEENRPFLTADTVKIRVKLLPLLLRREIALDRVALYNPSIVLRRYADRRTNWDDLLGHPLFVGSVDPNSSKIGMGLMQTISLRGLDVLNGSLVWDDSANAVQTRFDAIRLNTGEGLNFHFELDFHFTSPSHNLEAQALLAGDCRLDRQPFDLTLSNTSFGLKTTLHHSNADYVATAAGKADFALAAQELTLNAATVEAAGCKFSLDGIMKRVLSNDPDIQGKLVLMSVTPDKSLKGKLSPALFKRISTLKAETAFGFVSKTLTLTDLKATAPDFTLRGQASCEFAATPRVQAALALSKLDFDELFLESHTPASNRRAADEPFIPPWLAGLRQVLTGELALDVAEVKARSALAKDVAFKASLAPESAETKVRVGQIFGGKAEASAEWKKQDLTATLSLDHVQAGPITQLFLGREAAKGQAELKLTASATGDSVAAVASSLQAKLDLNMSQPSFHAAPGATKTKTATAQKPAPDTATGAATGTLATSRQIFAGDKAQLSLTLGAPPKNVALKYPFAAYGLTLDSRFEGVVYGQPTGPAPATSFGVSLNGKALVDTQDLKLATLDQTQVKAQYRVKLPNAKFYEAKLAAVADYNRERDTVLLKNLAFTAPNGKLTAELDVRNIFNQEQNPLTYSGSISVPVLSPRAVVQGFGFEMPKLVGDYCFHTFGINAKVRGGLDSVALENINMLWDKTTVTGRYSLTAATDGGLPFSRFDFNIDTFDLDAYFPPKKKANAPVTPDDEWFLGILRTLPLLGDVSIGAFKLYDLTLRNLKARGEGPAGAIRVKRVYGGFYEGTFDGRVDFFFAPNNVFSLDLDVVAKDFQLGPAVHDLGGGDYVNGASRFGLILKATGSNSRAFVGSISGQADFVAKNGYCILGKSEPTQIANPLGEMGKIGPQPAQPEKKYEPYRTPFTQAKGSCTMHNGFVRNEDFVLQGDVLNARGAGQVQLVDEILDYSLNLQAIGTPSYPIRIHGAFDKLAVDMSETKMLTDTAYRIGGSFFDVFKGILTLPFRAIELLKPPDKQQGKE